MESFNDKTCRMCLKYDKQQSVSLIWEVHSSGNTVADSVNFFFNIEILKTDSLKYICQPCLEKVDTVNAIYRDFLRADGAFHGIASVVVKEEIHIIPDDDEDCNADKPDQSMQESFILGMEDGSYQSHQEEDSKEFETDNEAPCDLTEEFAEKRKAKIKRREAVAMPKLPDNKCYICSTIFDTESEFDTHLSTHFHMLPYTCTICRKLIRTTKTLSVHLALHDESERPYKCRKCNARFLSRKNSLTHERIVHRMNVKMKLNIDGYADKRKMKNYTFQCVHCGRIFANRDALTRHENVHTGAARCDCKICDKTFSSKKNLNRHMLIHTEDYSDDSDDLNPGIMDEEVGSGEVFSFERTLEHSFKIEADSIEPEQIMADNIKNELHKLKKKYTNLESKCSYLWDASMGQQTLIANNMSAAPDRVLGQNLIVSNKFRFDPLINISVAEIEHINNEVGPGQKSDGKFLNKIVCKLWDEKELLDRSVYGKQSNKYKHLAPKRALEEEKTLFLKAKLLERCLSEPDCSATLAAKRAENSAVNKWLNSKLKNVMTKHENSIKLLKAACD